MNCMMAFLIFTAQIFFFLHILSSPVVLFTVQGHALCGTVALILITVFNHLIISSSVYVLQSYHSRGLQEIPSLPFSNLNHFFSHCVFIVLMFIVLQSHKHYEIETLTLVYF